MASITIRNLDDSLKHALRRRAAGNGRSMEEEVRQLLREALLRERTSEGLGTTIVNLFRDVGGVDLQLPKRSQPRNPPSFDQDEEVDETRHLPRPRS